MKNLLSYNKCEGSCAKLFTMIYKKKCNLCKLFKSSTEFNFGNAYCKECWKTFKNKKTMHTIKEKIDEDFMYS